MTHRIEPGSIVLTPTDARMLYQAARIAELRSRNRIGDTPLYRLLTDISLCAFAVPGAAPGILPRQDAASEERETWTVKEVARATGRSERAVRLDCHHNDLPATKQGNTWIITADDAKTYIASRRTH